MKPKKLYNDWYHKYFKIMKKHDPECTLEYNKFFKMTPSIKMFKKYRVSSLTKKLAKDVQISLPSKWASSFYLHNSTDLKNRALKLTVNINDVPCTFMFSNQIISATSINVVFNHHLNDEFNSIKTKIRYMVHNEQRIPSNKVFKITNPLSQEEQNIITVLNSIDIQNLTEEQRFQLSCEFNIELYEKVAKLTEVLFNSVLKEYTFNSIYFAFKQFQENNK